MSKTARELIAEQWFGPSPGYQMGDADAEAFIAALTAAGFEIVPKEPTEAMLHVGRDVIYGIGKTSGERCIETWRAMIAAASTPPREGDP